MADKHPKDNTECKSNNHGKHLCYFISQGFHFTDKDEYMAMIENPQFMCMHCGRVAHSDKNLCRPIKV